MTQAYRDWVAGGKRWTACKPARDLRALLLGMGCNPLSVGTIGDVEGHLKDPTPADHTPYSGDQWGMGKAYRKGYVMAIDVPHDTKNGVHCGKIAAKILEKKPPWVKYVIWNGPNPVGLRDRRKNWVKQSAGGHESHMHISFWAGYEEATVDWLPYLGKGSNVVDAKPDPKGGNDTAVGDSGLEKDVKTLLKLVKDVHYTLTKETPEHVRDTQAEQRDRDQDAAIKKLDDAVLVLTNKVDEVLGSVKVLAGEHNATHQDVEGKGDAAHNAKQ